MQLTDDYLEVGIISELDVDHDEFKEKLRRVEPKFSEAPEDLKDVQMIFDENLINHLLLALHHNSKVISLRELLLSWIPQKFQSYMMLAQAFFQTSSFSLAFPDILKEYPHGKLLDVRCGLSKKFLEGKFDKHQHNHEEGEDEDFHGVHASQVKFKKGNTLSFDVGFGCGLFVYMGTYDFKSSGTFTEHNLPERKMREEDWKNWRSFFFHGSGNAQVRFIDAHNPRQLVKAVVDDGDLHIN
jgi:hypothetical protein